MVEIITVEDRCRLNWEKKKLVVRVKRIVVLEINIVIENDISGSLFYGINGILGMGRNSPK